jgi:hypothetical protein
VTADPKPSPRVRVNREGWEALRSELPWRCQLCGGDGYMGTLWVGLSAHHLVNKPRDDVLDNLCVLCGHGTIGCHRDIEEWVGDARSRLREKLTERQVQHIISRVGEAGLDRLYPVA